MNRRPFGRDLETINPYGLIVVGFIAGFAVASILAVILYLSTPPRDEVQQVTTTTSSVR